MQPYNNKGELGYMDHMTPFHFVSMMFFMMILIIDFVILWFLLD